MAQFALQGAPAEVVTLCKFTHRSVEKAADQYFQERRWRYYVTPTSFVELLSTQSRMMSSLAAKLASVKQRLVVGMEKLFQAESVVQKLQGELAEMKPRLIEKSQEVESMMVQIQIDKDAADKTRVVVSKEENEASEVQRACKSIKEDAEADLAEVRFFRMLSASPIEW